mgnify:CR=1 FL=1
MILRDLVEYNFDVLMTRHWLQEYGLKKELARARSDLLRERRRAKEHKHVAR